MPNVSQPSPEDLTHSLELLVGEIGKSDPALLDSILGDATEEELVARGAEILTNRIVTDGARIFREAWDFWSKDATEAHKKRLRGFSQPLLALAAHELLALHRLEQQTLEDAQAKAKARAVGDEAASSAAAAALSLRDQAVGALRDAAGRSSALRAEVDAVIGTADDPQALSRGIKGLAGVLRGWLKKKDDKALAGRLKLANLDGEYADELEEAAQKVLASSAQAKRRISDKAAQSRLDRQDGVNILLLGQVVRAFESAHDIDRTIPRLVPISTRRLFNRNVGKKGEKKPEERPAEG